MRQSFFRAITFIIFIVSFSNTGYCQFDIQDIIDRVDTISDTSKKISTWLYISEYLSQAEPEKGYFYGVKALEEAILLGDSALLSDSYRLMAMSAAGMSRCDDSDSLFLIGSGFINNQRDRAFYLSAQASVNTLCGNSKNQFANYNEAKKIFEELGDEQNIALLLINMGVTYSVNSQYYKASSCYFEALDICERLNDEESIPIIYQNLGEVMAVQEQYDKAVGYYNSAIYGFEKLGFDKAIAAVYLNLGQIYIEIEQWDVAKSYLNKSYVIDTTLHLVDYESIALKQLGVTYLQTGHLESSEELVRAALRLQKQNDYRLIIPESQLILGQILLEQGEMEELNDIVEEALQRASDINDADMYASLLLLKSKALEQQKMYKEAFTALEEGTKLRDSIFNLEKTRSIMNLEAAYQTEVKEKQIDEFKFRDQLQQQKIRNKTNQVYLLIVSVILLMVVFVVFISYFRRKRFLEMQQREQKFLKDRFEAEEKARDKIAAELHDDIGGQMVGLILQLQSGGKLEQEELDKLQKVYQGVRRLSHSLDEPIFTNMTLQNKLQNYISELKDQVDFNIVFIDDLNLSWSQIAEGGEIQRNIYRIVQELLTNTAKFAEASEAEIQLMNENNHISFLYEDNGVGMDLQGASSEINFNTIRKRLEMFAGKLEVNSKPGSGFFVSIVIPFKRK